MCFGGQTFQWLKEEQWEAAQKIMLSACVSGFWDEEAEECEEFARLLPLETDGSLDEEVQRKVAVDRRVAD